MRPLHEVPARRAAAWLRWFGVSRLVGVVASIGVVGVGAWWLVRVPPPPPESRIPFDVAVTLPPGAPVPGAPTATMLDGPAATTTTVPTRPVVHVAGAVAHPGVYALAPGSRAHDAVLAAGGATPDADLSMVNLAAPLDDASQVYVPRRGEGPRRAAPATPSREAKGVTAPPGAAPTPAPGSGTSAPTPASPLDLNAASAAALEALPGIGPRTAAAIVAHRERHGPFASVEALLDVRGIGPATLGEIRPLVRIG
jgi:competence protein ComEA